MSKDLIQRNDTDLTVSLSAEAHALKEQALEAGALIGQVVDPATQDVAVQAQQEIRGVLNLIEAARKHAKNPVLELGREIDATARSFKQELEKEERRIAELVGDYQEAEAARLKAMEAKRNEELTRLERERQEQLAEAGTIEERQEINETFDELARSQEPVKFTTAKGQTVKEDWDFEVTDVWALARAHPMCVKIEPLRSQIRALLDSGTTVRGVKAKRVAKSVVRAARPIKQVAAAT